MRIIILLCLAFALRASSRAAESAFTGTYKNEEATVQIKEAEGGQFSGTISAHGQTFPFIARPETVLTGTMTVDDEKTPFRITLKGAKLTFATEDETHKLTKIGATAAQDAKPVETAATNAPAARRLQVNGVVIEEERVRKLEAEQHIVMPRGDFWYDKVSGAWGVAGGPTIGFTTPGVALGGPLKADASRGNTGVFINNRELPLSDVVGLQRLGVPVQRGRWWVDASGNFGVENSPFTVGNIFQFSQGKGGSYQRSTAGGYIGGDGQTSYFFDPKSGSSVMTGN